MVILSKVLWFLRFEIVNVTLIFSFCCSEYIKVFDGNGTEVLSLNGCTSFFNRHQTFRKISIDGLKRITIEIFLIHSSSYLEIDYSTLKQDLDSGKKISNVRSKELFNSKNLLYYMKRVARVRPFITKLFIKHLYDVRMN